MKFILADTLVIVVKVIKVTLSVNNLLVNRRLSDPRVALQYELVVLSLSLIYFVLICDQIITE